MKLRNNQTLTPAVRADLTLQLLTEINAALHHKDSDIELSPFDIKALLVRSIQMNTGCGTICIEDDPVSRSSANTLKSPPDRHPGNPPGTAAAGTEIPTEERRKLSAQFGYQCDHLIDSQFRLNTDVVRAEKQWQALLQHKDSDLSVLASILAHAFSQAGRRLARHPD